MTERKVFEDSITPLPDEPGPTPRGLIVQAAEPDTREEEMTVLFSLEIAPDDEKDLEERVARGEVVPAKELQKRYVADAGDREQLVKWLKAQNFDVTEVSSDGTSVYARASVDQIEKSLGVNMVRVTKDGVTYTAAKNAPSLPADVANSVHAIIGLQPFRQARKQIRMGMLHDINLMSLTDSVDGTSGKRRGGGGRAKTAKPAAATQALVSNTPPYVVSEVLKAYGAQGLNVTGKGQTIAILIDTLPAASDVRRSGRPTTCRARFLGSKRSTSTAVHCLRPQARRRSTFRGRAVSRRTRRCVSTPPARLSWWIWTAPWIASSPTCRRTRECVSSRSAWASASSSSAAPTARYERSTQNSCDLPPRVSTCSSRPATPAHDPTFPGTAPAAPPRPNTRPPTTSVVAVGGTTLKLTSAGDLAREVGWPGSGGGKSIFFLRPVWQTGAGVPPGGERLVPDVSLAADPNTGAFLILNGRPVPGGVGGTSWSAPVWAGFCALMNEAREKAGKALLGFLNPLIYPLMGTDSFRDITAGSNGDFTAGPGYDLVTGIGVPNVGQLTKALTNGN